MTDEHLLNRRWILWYDSPSNHKSCATINMKNMIKVYTISSIQTFWRVYNNIFTVKNLYLHGKYMLSDSNNDIESFDSSNFIKTSIPINNEENINDTWTNLILDIIGESFPYSDDIHGISITKKRFYYELNIWSSRLIDVNYITEQLH